jgi:hypothetical protein
VLTLSLSSDQLFLKTTDRDSSILLLSDADFLLWSASDSIPLHALWVKKIMNFFVVKFHERALHAELGKLGLSLTMCKLVKDKLEHPRYNTDLVERHTN